MECFLYDGDVYHERVDIYINPNAQLQLKIRISSFPSALCSLIFLKFFKDFSYIIYIFRKRNGANKNGYLSTLKRVILFQSNFSLLSFMFIFENIAGANNLRKEDWWCQSSKDVLTPNLLKYCTALPLVEAATQNCSGKKVVLKILQISQENVSVGVSF